MLYKDLYLANSVEVLDLIATEPVTKVRNVSPNKYVSILKGLYRQSYEDPYDLEKLYIFLGRWLQMYEAYCKSEKDVKFVELRFGQEFRKVQAHFYEARKLLKQRYEAKNLRELKEIRPKKVKIVAPTDEPIDPGKKKRIFNCEYITCVQLYSALEQRINLLLVDARPDYDFKESRPDVPNCINVPEQIIKKGMSANVLGQMLPFEVRDIWEIRDTFDAIVLYDWGSSFESSMTELHELRTALVEWDPNRNYSEPPVILKGGYLEFLQTYPMKCVNPQIILSKRNTELDELIYLDTIEYPTETDSKTPLMGPVNSEFEVDELNESIKRITLLDQYKNLTKDREEIVQKLMGLENEWKTVMESMNDNVDQNTLASLAEKERQLRCDLDEIKDDLNLKVEEILQIKNDLDLYATFDPDVSQKENDHLKEIWQAEADTEDKLQILEMMAYEHAKALEQARSSKPKYIDVKDEFKKKVLDAIMTDDDSSFAVTPEKPEKPPVKHDIPLVDRANKPRTSPVASHLTEPLEQISPGKVGLKNIRNTCYMNAALQCFRNLPRIKTLFCTGEYATNNIIRDPPAIIYETAYLVRYLWTDLTPYIEPIGFYQRICDLQPIYQQGLHEDSMEFFLFLLNNLAEDCYYKTEQKAVLTPRQRAWHKQFQGRNSIFQDLFYHQIKITQHCDNCNKRTFRFEMESTFMLSVPDKEFNLQELMYNYMSDYIIKEYCCSKCKKPVRNTKQISYAPRILVIVLKRYKQLSAGSATVLKQDSKGTFPLTNFMFGKYRYDLNSITMHIGDIQHGHYTAACLIKNDGWYEFDDHVVKKLNIDDDSVKYRACAYFYTICDNN